MQKNSHQESFDKLKACIVHVCGLEQPENAQLDHIKLNKVLWFSDAASYMRTGKSITNSKYVRKKHGPVAKFMKAASDELVKDEVLSDGRHFDSKAGAWIQVYNVIDPDGTDKKLSDDEKKFLDTAFKGVCLSSDTNTISERTHGEIWELAADGQEIPLRAMFAERLGRIMKSHINDAFAS